MTSEVDELNKVFVRPQPPTFWAAAEVVAVEQVTPLVRRVVLGGAEVRPFIDVFRPADAVKLLFTVPPSPEPIEYGADGMQPRAYTLTNVNREAGTFDIEILSHGEGPGTVWAATAQPGWHVGLGGPRFGYDIDESATAFALFADLSALPAAIEIARAISDRPVDLVIEVPNEGEIRELDLDARVTWLMSGDRPCAALIERAREREWSPEAATQVWAAGESGAMKELRRFIRVDRGLPRERVTVTGYWTEGIAGIDQDRLAAAARLARNGEFEGNQYDLDSYEPEVDGRSRG